MLWNSKKYPTKETENINPKYPYALSKYMGEQLVLHWAKVYKLKCNSIRIFNAYGLRSKTSGAYGSVIGTFMKQKLRKILNPCWGWKSNKRFYQC